MPKQVHECVQRLLANPKFNPDIGKGKSSKTKEEAAWAICTARYEKDKKECAVCDITDDSLFMEAVESLMKTLSEEKPKNEQDYVLEGIEFKQFVEAISKEDLDKINKFAVKPVESKDITVFTALLIDDKVTRNNTLYTKDFQSMLLSLPAGEGNFVGAPILFGESQDHQHTASSQVGRIFDAWQVISEDKHYGVMAKIYVLNEGNEDLINKINSGVLKEMSIATKVEMPLCSICGQDVRMCDHNPGQNGCHVIMSGRGFVAEASFVAVPGSNSAKILSEDETKKFLRLENLKELVIPFITESVDPISKAAAATRDEILAKMKELSDKYDAMVVKIEEFNGKLTNEQEVISYKIDILSTLTELKENIEESKNFIVRTLAKYGIQGVDFKTDIVPELSQGLKGEDVNMIFNLFYDNIEILGINLSKIEAHLKVTPLPSNMSFTGDKNNIPMLVRFLVKKMDDIKNRILKLQGQFDLQALERSKAIIEATKYGILCGKFGFNEKNLSEKFFEAMTTEEIVAIKEKFFEEGSKLYTPEVIKIEEPKDENKIINEEKPKPTLKEMAKKIVNGGKSNE